MPKPSLATNIWLFVLHQGGWVSFDEIDGAFDQHTNALQNSLWYATKRGYFKSRANLDSIKGNGRPMAEYAVTMSCKIPAHLTVQMLSEALRGPGPPVS